jgi:hypothetical protein
MVADLVRSVKPAEKGSKIEVMYVSTSSIFSMVLGCPDLTTMLSVSTKNHTSGSLSYA